MKKINFKNYAKQANLVLNNNLKKETMENQIDKTYVELSREMKTTNSFTHHFTDLVQILEYCKSIGIDDNYLIQGLENTINQKFNIKKGLLNSLKLNNQ